MKPTEATQKTRPGPLPKHLHTPRTCSAPTYRTAKDTHQKEQPPPHNKSSRTGPGKKLEFGTTRAFRLRLKKVLHLREDPCECVSVTMSREQPRQESRRKSPATGGGAGRRRAGRQREGLNDETEMVKQAEPRGEGGDGRLSGGNAVGGTSGEPSTGGQTPPEDGGLEPPAGGRRGGPAPSHSSVDDHEEADYSDDFNSLHASDAPWLDPEGSLGSSRAQTPSSPEAGHSGSGRVTPAPPPGPTKSSGSPQRSLSGRRLIRPRTTTSALSLSSDDVHVDGSLSSQTAGSSSPWGGENSNSPAQGGRAQPQSSEEPEELLDDLGTLNFREECRNISELLASNLPAYTI